jgi:hypothetical protein
MGKATSLVTAWHINASEQKNRRGSLRGRLIVVCLVMVMAGIMALSEVQ